MTAPPVRGTYALVDHHGEPVTQESYRGRWQLIQFGFTSCTVVCPRALAKLTDALDVLETVRGPAPLVALYVTVDPDHDSPAVMKAFLESAYPRFTGLTGSSRQIDDARRAFKIFTRRRDGDDAIQHTAITYLLDPEGRPARYWPDTRSFHRIAEDLVSLLDDHR